MPVVAVDNSIGVHHRDDVHVVGHPDGVRVRVRVKVRNSAYGIGHLDKVKVMVKSYG